MLKFLGTNNYYLHYKSHKMIDDVLEDAKKMKLKVIRLWGFLDGTPSDGIVLQPELGVYNEDVFNALIMLWLKQKNSD